MRNQESGIRNQEASREHAKSINPEEIAKFEAMADTWWDERGPFAPLHKFNPLRVGYIRPLLEKREYEDSMSETTLSASRASRPSAKARKPERGAWNILDIGCGGGILSESLARLGAQVTGIDASEKNIAVAKLHAEKSGLAIDYRHVSAEELAASGVQFDMVCAMEVLEHVDDAPGFLRAAAKMVKPGGLLLAATLNRTPKAYALAIIGAEYLLRWLPRGTHDWKKFLKPSEIETVLRQEGMRLKELKGASYNPLKDSWSLSEDVSVNYMLLAKKDT